MFAEVCVVLGAAGLAGVAAGSAAQYIVVRTVTLCFTDEIRTPRVVATLDAQGIGVLMAVVVTVLVGIATCAASLAVRRARASTLRESVRKPALQTVDLPCRLSMGTLDALKSR